MQLLLEIARAEIGVKEIPGVKNNPRILHYANRAGLNWVKNDETSWCGIFLGFCVAEIPEFMRPEGPRHLAATARQWLNYGAPVEIEKAKPGDIVIFWRNSIDSWQGHCTIFVEKSGSKIKCLGGNQSDSVKITTFSKSRILGIRRL